MSDSTANDTFGSLRGRTALVTGASRGIGAVIASTLAASGVRVCLAGRDLEALEATAAGLPGDPVVITADLGTSDAPARVGREAAERLGGIDILVNNAGIGAKGLVDELEAATIDAAYATNVRALLLLTGAVVPSMRKRGGGSIVNISSVAGLVGTSGRVAYAATKGAVDAITRSLASELGPDGIRVNSIAPGIVDGPNWQAQRDVPGVLERTAGQTPLGRWASPGEVAATVAFLASDAGGFITGQTLTVDGGLGMSLAL